MYVKCCMGAPNYGKPTFVAIINFILAEIT